MSHISYLTKPLTLNHDQFLKVLLIKIYSSPHGIVSFACTHGELNAHCLLSYAYSSYIAHLFITFIATFISAYIIYLVFIQSQLQLNIHKCENIGRSHYAVQNN